MRWETAEPPGAGGAPSAQPGPREEPQQPVSEEHLGPISFTRETKDDGRMLILYRRDHPPRRDG